MFEALAPQCALKKARFEGVGRLEGLDVSARQNGLESTEDASARRRRLRTRVLSWR